MKKFFAAAAMSLAALFLFTGCSAQIVANISSGWLTDPTNDYDPAFYESLDYKVRFDKSETEDPLSVSIDSGNSSYNITTEAVGTQTFRMPDGTENTYTNVYHLTMTLKVSATYTYTKDNGDTLEFSFGGENDTAPDNEDFAPEDADTYVSEIWFTAGNSSVVGTDTVRPDFSPIRSVQTVRSHGASDPSNDSDVFVAMNDYSITIHYDQTCQNATLEYTDNFADLTDEERAAGDYVRKAAMYFPDSRTIGDLQKSYTCVDNEQLIFIARGLDMSEGASNTLTVVSGTADRYPSRVRISCSEPINSHVSFTMIDTDGNTTVYGQNEDDEIAVAKMTFALTDAGTNIGESTTVTYARRSDPNTTRCLPVCIENPYARTIGNYVYELETASYQRPAGEQA